MMDNLEECLTSNSTCELHFVNFLLTRYMSRRSRFELHAFYSFQLKAGWCLGVHYASCSDDIFGISLVYCHGEKIVRWKGGMEVKGLKMNTGKMKVMLATIGETCTHVRFIYATVGLI